MNEQNSFFDLHGFRTQLDSLYKTMLSYENICDKLTQVDNWTIRNNVAHLIDSASNNHQRFVRLQIDSIVEFAGYDAETWVSVTNLQKMPFKSLVELWKLYNDYLLELISNINPDCLKNTWSASKDSECLTLEFLVNDYFSHLTLHENMMRVIAQNC